MHHRPTAFVALALLLFWILPAHAGDTEPGRLRVGTSGDYAPFSSADPSAATSLGEPTGFDPAVARAYAASRGLRIEWVQFRWPELMEDLAAGRFDIAMSGVTVRPDRSLAGRFSLPVAMSGAMLLLVPELEGRSLSTLDDPAITIAVNAGGHLERVARSRFTRARLAPIPDNAGVLRAVIDGEAQVAVTDTQEVEYWRARHPTLRAIGPFTRDRKAYLAGPDAGERVADLDQWLLASEANGSLEQLRREHLGSSHAAVRPALPLEALLASMDERLALMPLVAEVKRARGLAISHPDQEERVIAAALAAVERAASESGEGVRPPPAAVRAFFRTQIEAAKQIQQNVLDAAPRASEDPLPDLAQDLRPALLRIGDRIAMLLTRLPANLERERVQASTHRALAAHHLGAPRLDNMANAIVALTRTGGGGGSGGGGGGSKSSGGTTASQGPGNQ